MGTRAAKARIRNEKKKLVFKFLDEYPTTPNKVVGERFHINSTTLSEWIKEYKEKKNAKNT